MGIVDGKTRVFSYLDNLSTVEIKELENSTLYNAFPNIKKPSIRRIKSKWFEKQKAQNDLHDQPTDRSPANNNSKSNTTKPSGYSLTGEHCVDKHRGGGVIPPSHTHTTALCSGGGGAAPSTSTFDPVKLMIAQACDGNFNATKYLVENRHLLEQQKARPPWYRPLMLFNKPPAGTTYDERFRLVQEDQLQITTPGMNPRQIEIINAINDPNVQVILIEGDRRTGKSTVVWVGIHEAIWDGYIRNWGFWASTEKTATKIHNDVYSDQITWNQTSILHRGHSRKRTAILDGGFDVNATTVSDSSGKAYQGIWLDEFHIMLKDNPETVATVAGILRSEPNLKLIISMNKGTGAYEVLIEKMKPLIESGRAAFFTLEKKDTVHISDANDELTGILMEAAMDEDFADRQLRNKQSYTGEPFPPHLVIDAMNSYDTFMDNDKVKGRAFHTVVGVDPGFNHPVGIFVAGCFRGHFFELESMLIKGTEASEERIKTIVAELASDYNAEAIVCESNSGGLHWMKTWRNLGYTTYAQNFENNPLKPLDRKNMITTLQNLMKQHRLHFCSKQLQTQLYKYDPDKDKNDSKGDLADAFIHAMFRLTMQYQEIEGGEQIVW